MPKFDAVVANPPFSYRWEPKEDTLREEGKNIPPSWLDRSRESRKKREGELGRLLRSGKLDAANYIREWELYYRKECFYYGLRALMELQRQGKTKL